jgi:hypothetical protein
LCTPPKFLRILIQTLLILRLEDYITRNMTVTKNAMPHPIAANLIRVLLTRILLEYSCDEVRSSEVMRSIIAEAASHRLISVRLRGMFTLVTLLFTQRPRMKQAHMIQLFLENFSNIIKHTLQIVFRNHFIHNGYKFLNVNFKISVVSQNLQHTY